MLSKQAVTPLKTGITHTGGALESDPSFITFTIELGVHPDMMTNATPEHKLARGTPVLPISATVAVSFTSFTIMQLFLQ